MGRRVAWGAALAIGCSGQVASTVSSLDAGAGSQARDASTDGAKDSVDAATDTDGASTDGHFDALGPANVPCACEVVDGGTVLPCRCPSPDEYCRITYETSGQAAPIGCSNLPDACVATPTCACLTQADLVTGGCVAEGGTVNVYMFQ